MNTAIAVKEENAVSRIKGYLAHPKIVEQMQGLLPKYLTPERMTRTFLAAVQRTPKLLECSPESLVEALMKCSEWGLEPVGEHGVWLIPYGDKVQAIRDYRGEMDLAMRASKEVANFLIPRVVYENDDFDVEYGEYPSIKHKPTPLTKDRGELVGVYAIAKLRDGSTKGVVLTKQDVERHRQASRAKDSGPWKTHTESMWLKSAVKELCKWLPRMGMYSRMQDDEYEDFAAAPPVPELASSRPALQPEPAPGTSAQALVRQLRARNEASSPPVATPPPSAEPNPPSNTEQRPAAGEEAKPDADKIAAIKAELQSLGAELVQLVGDAKRAETVWRESVQSLRGAKTAEHFGSRLDQARTLLAKHRTAKLEASVAANETHVEMDQDVPWDRPPTDQELPSREPGQEG